MSKVTLLTDEEVEKRKLKTCHKILFDAYQEKHNLKKSDLKILDFGHGKGITVARLRELNYQAYGVEIGAKYYNNGFNWFKSKGYNPEIFLFLMDENNIIPFPDNFFDIIITEQVLEHVENLEHVLKEWSRVTKKGGVGFHIFPAKYRVVEGHLDMAFVHWLPKNKLRKWLIKFWVKLGIYRRAKRFEGKTIEQITMDRYTYSVNSTFYRSKSFLIKSFNKVGFDINFKLIKRRYSKGILQKINYQLFPQSVHIETKKK